MKSIIYCTECFYITLERNRMRMYASKMTYSLMTLDVDQSAMTALYLQSILLAIEFKLQHNNWTELD